MGDQEHPAVLPLRSKKKIRNWKEASGKQNGEMHIRKPCEEAGGRGTKERQGRITANDRTSNELCAVLGGGVALLFSVFGTPSGWLLMHLTSFNSYSQPWRLFYYHRGVELWRSTGCSASCEEADVHMPLIAHNCCPVLLLSLLPSGHS